MKRDFSTINAEREFTYFMLKQNSEKLISMLSGIGVNQPNINLNFAMHNRAFGKKRELLKIALIRSLQSCKSQ
ncbi:MAG: hypothetical protein MTP17_01920 [Candidatus Midichloria sp.]|nr:MAG: hypothetical protein MTP17_01920 [Candidatus Midichloria sp.]